ncbi:MAG TPA: hypothetical protein PLT91_07470 [Clostridia bacterium]|nr:hypothetical protein [Clostridia bacterium]
MAGWGVTHDLKAQKATVAVYIAEEYRDKDLNLLSSCYLVGGYSHEYCIAKGKSTDFSIKFYDGEVYSIYGNMIPVFNVPATRYRILNQLHESIL